MPTYEYECRKCHHRFEAFQSIKEAPKKTCPHCKGRLKRLLGTGGGIIFKGSGFHATDYRTPSYSAAVKKEADSTRPSTTPKSPAPKTPASKD